MFEFIYVRGKDSKSELSLPWRLELGQNCLWYEVGYYCDKYRELVVSFSLKWLRFNSVCLSMFWLHVFFIWLVWIGLCQVDKFLALVIIVIEGLLRVIQVVMVFHFTPASAYFRCSWWQGLSRSLSAQTYWALLGLYWVYYTNSGQVSIDTVFEFFDN